MITDEDKLVAREIKQDCYSPFSDGYGGWSEFDEDITQGIISAYRQRIEARCSLQFGEFNRRREDDIAALREENARLKNDRDAMAISAQEAWIEVRKPREENARLREAAQGCVDRSRPYEDESGVIAVTLGDFARLRAALASALLAPAQEQGESDIVSAWEKSGYSSEGEAFAASLGYTKDHLLYWEAATFYDGYKAALASARPAPVQEQGEALVRRISAELHRLPKNNKGHEIGMMEVGYDSNGQLNYGPLWLSVAETDAILLGICRALLARKPVEEPAKPAECVHEWGELEPCVYPVIELRHCKHCGVDLTTTVKKAKLFDERKPEERPETNR